MLPPELNQKYEVRGTLGAGAMGTVYDAVDRIIERRVAIKVVKRPAEHDPEAVEAHARFRREAQAAGRLSHPNIVGVYDYGENATDAWIVMELVEGKSLKDRLDKQERFTIPDIVRIMGEVCAGLAYSHQRGVVHRDIKPGNIMMTTDGQVKIADFGIARLENSSMTQVGTLIGTPSYMAPEQFRGEPVDLRADIWSSGVMLYQLLTGEKPFEGGFSAVMHKALHTEPPPPSQLSVTTPRGFDAVIARALAKRPDDRFRSASEFAEAIRAAVNAPAPAAEPAGLPGLPGLHDDATMVSARPVAGGTQQRAGPAPAVPPAPPAPSGRGAPMGLIAAGLGAVVVAGGAGWYFLAGPGAGTDPAVLERQRQEQAAADAARDAAARQQAAQDAAAREAAAREVTARQQAAAEQAAREQAAQEAAARQQAQRAAAAREQAAADAQAAAARDQAAAEQQARDAAAREQAARNAAAREQAQRERAAAEQQARDAAAREQAAREAAAREQALREQAARDQAAREQAARDAAAREQAARDEAARQQQQQVAALSRLDMRAAAQALATGTPCSLIAWSATDRSMTLSGVVRRGDDAAIRRDLAARGVPEDAARLTLASFDGPYCPALDLLRPVLGPAGVAPSVEVVGRLPLQKGELMRLDVQMPDWPAHLYVAYFMQSGQVANLVPSALQAAGARVRLGEPQGNFTGWEVDEPYGTDLAVVIASDRPLFGNSRPVVESQDAYMAALAAALRTARASGTRVVVRPLVVETVARR
ncbi:serine/threonine-protein kinase [Roseomonas fluvialis]|uniref:non-specific serine/threonine protein kinase n=1 Tax=Roseomonas fluvialis TaxID=1750527 RepID=A0ABM7Y636_9PROT|nr:serine/threonine-protein kinase [Roseomonas fluvialis]BDG73387.1 hypothetical protein Rmf_33160 [Roseomonas fluvialis]